ncbi:MAG TPA: DUF971 domain-containing protein [Bryobacteraceae bacterium]|nr:DUF971 domain-containing protein [Bryobacteraceae bacterium]
MTLAAEPEHIAISKSKGITIDWKDGHRSEYGLTYLRDECPCAECAGTHGTPPRPKTADSPFPMFQPALKMLRVSPVGNYAIAIEWSDGHKSGIYSYDHFREICPCAECRAAAARQDA